MKLKNNFVECKTVEEANSVDLDKYTFIDWKENAYGTRVYLFKIRQKARG